MPELTKETRCKRYWLNFKSWILGLPAFNQLINHLIVFSIVLYKRKETKRFVPRLNSEEKEEDMSRNKILWLVRFGHLNPPREYNY